MGDNKTEADGFDPGPKPRFGRGASPLDGQGECTRCAALCCMALAFDAGQGFGVDKPNGAACPNLGADDLCTIHGEREAHGFTGCVTFDCGGAGQYVTETLFQGRHWREAPELVGPMTKAFSDVRLLAELDGLLVAAAQLPLAPDDRARCWDLQGQLWPAEGWTADGVRAFTRGPGPQAVRAFVKSLGHYLKPPAG